MNNPIVTLDQNAVVREIERQIALRKHEGQSGVHDHKLINAIASIPDNTIKAELLEKCLQSVTDHQNTINVAFLA